jgi:hypothetical protein
VFAEAEWPEDAADLYECGADFVVIAPQLSAEQLTRYLESHLTNPEEFETVIEADLELLRSTELFPTTRSAWGETDD